MAKRLDVVSLQEIEGLEQDRALRPESDLEHLHVAIRGSHGFLDARPERPEVFCFEQAGRRNPIRVGTAKALLERDDLRGDFTPVKQVVRGPEPSFPALARRRRLGFHQPPVHRRQVSMFLEIPDLGEVSFG